MQSIDMYLLLGYYGYVEYRYVLTITLLMICKVWICTYY